MAGLPGTGKSTLSRVVAARMRGLVLDKDMIRAALFPPSHVEYSSEQDDFCQSVMLETAEYLLAKDRSLPIFLDGRTFSRRYQRERAIAASVRLGAPWAVIQCVCSEATALARLERDAATHLAKNRSPELYHAIRAQFEPIEPPKLVMDTDEDLDANAGRAESYLRQAASAPVL
jgi:adenylylsulfate kinase